MKTKNLGYHLSLKIQSLTNNELSKISKILNKVQNSIPIFFQNFLNLSSTPFVSSSFMVANVSCRNNITGSVDILADIDVVITEMVDRKYIEDKLVYINERNDGTLTLCITEDTPCPEVLRIKFNIRRENRGMDIEKVLLQLRLEKVFCNELVERKNNDDQSIILSTVNELLLCPQVEINNNELTIDLATRTIYLKDKMQIDIERVKVTKSGVRICINTLESLYTKDQTNSTILDMVIKIITVVSLMCLLVSFITYCLFPRLRTLPGKNNMSLVFSLFWLQAFFLFGHNVAENNSSLCKAVGITVHFFLLAYFASISVCTFHMMRSIGNLQLINADNRRTFLFYLSFSYITPILVIGLNIALRMWQTKDIGYGGNGVCFLNDRTSVTWSVIVPLSCICSLNVVFFIKTVYNIRSTPKILRSTSHRTNKGDIIIYFKLFSITGITWLLQLVDLLFPMSFLSVGFSILNVLQGVFIFVSYICNSRVVTLYRGLCRRQRAAGLGSTGHVNESSVSLSVL